MVGTQWQIAPQMKDEHFTSSHMSWNIRNNLSSLLKNAEIRELMLIQKSMTGWK